jgi:O-methyltransferase
MGFLAALAGRIYNARWFLSKAVNPEDRRLRTGLLKKFREIERNIRVEHMEREMLLMADFLLTTKASGCMVECGCFLGGSSAKLSLVASATGRKLYVCDSFEGLPEVKPGEAAFASAATGQRRDFKTGEYAAGIEVVRENIRRWGDLSVCTLVPGFFSETLPGLQAVPCFVFSDADLVQSTRDVLSGLWPRIADGGRFYSHDMNLTGLVEGIMDGDFWMNEIGQPPPVLFGAGYGCGYGAGGIAYSVKKARKQS